MARDAGVSLKVRGTSQKALAGGEVYSAFLSLKVFSAAKPRLRTSEYFCKKYEHSPKDCVLSYSDYIY